MKQVAALFLAGCSITLPVIAGTASIAASRQCLVVVTDSLSATTGTMFVFERSSPSAHWQRRESRIPVVVGSARLAAGVDSSALVGRQIVPALKIEGDHKAPAGVFGLSRVFGYASRAETKMPYLALTSTVFGID